MLSPSTFKVFAGVKLDQLTVGWPNFNYQDYNGLDLVASQLEVSIPAESEKAVTFPFPSRPVVLALAPQYDATSLFARVYKQNEDPTGISLPVPVEYCINAERGVHSLAAVKLATTQVYFGEYNLLNILGEGAEPLTWYFYNDALVSQVVKVIMIDFVDFPWKNY